MNKIFLNKHKKKPTHSSNNILLNNKFPFTITESYKLIRTNLSYVLAANKCNTILFTSSTQAEGKSTTCSNLATTIVQTNSRVLIIDADMRKPVQHKNFKKDNVKGLSNILIGDCSINLAIKEIIDDSLYLITAGTIPPNPAELLSSDSMRDLIKYVSDKFDYVLIDSPPVNVICDALGIMNENVGVVLVCKSNHTSQYELSKAIENIKVTKSKILGTIVTSVNYDKTLSNYKYKSYEYQYK